MPEELNEDFCKEVSGFYQDYERMVLLRQQLTAPGLADQEFMKIYRDSNFHNLMISLYQRRGEISAKDSHKQIMHVIRLYHTKIKNRRQDGSRAE